MSEMNSAEAIYETHTQAEEVLKELQKSGFDTKKMSIVGKDYHTDEHVVGYNNAGDRIRPGDHFGCYERHSSNRSLFLAPHCSKSSVLKND